MHSETPELRIKMSSHANCGGLVSFSFDNFSTAGANQDCVLSAEADGRSHGIHRINLRCLEIDCALLCRTWSRNTPDVHKTVSSARNELL